VKFLPHNQAAKRVLLKVEKSARPLDIGQRSGVSVKVQFVQPAADQAVTEIA
jgi:hypothetical protein